mgnify:CR=1 FL=1
MHSTLKFRKKITALTLVIFGFGIIAAVSFNVISASAATLSDYGIKEYNGVFKDQAFAWSGSNDSDYVSAEIEAGLNNFLGFTDDWDGWVQTPQVSYRSTTARGLHSAGSSAPYDFQISNP